MGFNTTYIASYTTGSGGVITVINHYLIPVIFTIALLVFLFGVAKAYIISRGDEGAVKQGHQLILWGVIGFAVMLSIWGIVNLFQSFLGITNGAAPKPPCINVSGAPCP